MSSPTTDRLAFHRKHVAMCFNTSAPGAVGIVNRLFSSTAEAFLAHFEADPCPHADAELSTALANLVAAKDAAVRAVLIATQAIRPS